MPAAPCAMLRNEFGEIFPEMAKGQLKPIPNTAD